MLAEQEEVQLEDRVIKTDRVRKTVKGGQIPSLRVVVAVGDRKGMVGVAVGKARQTPDAIRKATESAKRQMVLVPLKGATIPHQVEAKVGGVKVMLKPASRGTGLVAGQGVREVLEMAGVEDVLSKSFGAKNTLNRSLATFAALRGLRSAEQVFELRQAVVNRRPSRPRVVPASVEVAKAAPEPAPAEVEVEARETEVEVPEAVPEAALPSDEIQTGTEPLESASEAPGEGDSRQ